MGDHDSFYGVVVPAVVAPAVTALASVAASLWLLWALRKVFHSHDGAEALLFPRQLKSLAFADLICSVFVFAWCVIGGEMPPVTLDHGWDHIVTFENNSACKVIHFGLRVGECSSAFMAAHLAVAVAASAPRCEPVLRVLSWTILPVWPLSVVLAARDTALTVWEFSSPDPDRSPRCRPGNMVYFGSVNLETGTFLLCIVTLIIAYVVAVVRLLQWDQATFVSTRRAWSRVMTYPLLAIFTLGPTVVYHIIPRYQASQDARVLAFMALGSNGICNALAYMLHSSNGRELRRRINDTSTISDVNLEAGNGNGLISNTLRRRFGSFEVSIGGAQIFYVSTSQKDAMAMSESETNMLAGLTEPLVQKKPPPADTNGVGRGKFGSRAPTGLNPADLAAIRAAHADDDDDDDSANGSDTDDEGFSNLVADLEQRRENRRRHVQTVLVRQEWQKLIWRSVILLFCGVGGPIAVMYGLSLIPQPSSSEPLAR